jgi:hypothetical protein
MRSAVVFIFENNDTTTTTRAAAASFWESEVRCVPRKWNHLLGHRRRGSVAIHIYIAYHVHQGQKEGSDRSFPFPEVYIIYIYILFYSAMVPKRSILCRVSAVMSGGHHTMRR